MNQLSKAVLYVVLGSLVLPAAKLLNPLGSAVAGWLDERVGTPAAAAMLMLALLCAVLALCQTWAPHGSRDQQI